MALFKIAKDQEKTTVDQITSQLVTAEPKDAGVIVVVVDLSSVESAAKVNLSFVLCNFFEDAMD